MSYDIPESSSSQSAALLMGHQDEGVSALCDPTYDDAEVNAMLDEIHDDQKAVSHADAVACRDGDHHGRTLMEAVGGASYSAERSYRTHYHVVDGATVRTRVVSYGLASFRGGEMLAHGTGGSWQAAHDAAMAYYRGRANLAA